MKKRRIKPKIERTCEICGETQLINKGGKSKICRPCFMKVHPNRLGTGKGWYVDSFGYISGCIGGVYCRQHRYVMEKALGRKLDSKEHVHHTDGDKTNNQLLNLMLFPDSNSHHEWHKKYDPNYKPGRKK